MVISTVRNIYFVQYRYWKVENSFVSEIINNTLWDNSCITVTKYIYTGGLRLFIVITHFEATQTGTLQTFRFPLPFEVALNCLGNLYWLSNGTWRDVTCIAGVKAEGGGSRPLRFVNRIVWWFKSQASGSTSRTVRRSTAADQPTFTPHGRKYFGSGRVGDRIIFVCRSHFRRWLIVRNFAFSIWNKNGKRLRSIRVRLLSSKWVAVWFLLSFFNVLLSYLFYAMLHLIFMVSHCTIPIVSLSCYRINVQAILNPAHTALLRS